MVANPQTRLLSRIFFGHQYLPKKKNIMLYIIILHITHTKCMRLINKVDLVINNECAHDAGHYSLYTCCACYACKNAHNVHPKRDTQKGIVDTISMAYLRLLNGCEFTWASHDPKNSNQVHISNGSS